MEMIAVEASVLGCKIASFRHLCEGGNGDGILYSGRKGRVHAFSNGDEVAL
jgi:hypothetical protein